MSNESDKSTDVVEEEVDLFAKDVNDDALLGVSEVGDESAPAQNVDTLTPKEAETEDNIPEKYKGKSITDVIDMHRNLETAYGRHNNELGELRQLTDQILKQQLGETKAAEQTVLDSDTLLENPSDAINGAVAANPKLVAIEAKLEARERADNLSAFNRAHPNAKDTVNDPRFLAWVEASPTRIRLLQQANTSYDYELAGEILSTYASLNPAEAAAAKVTETKAALSNAKPGAGSGGKSKRKIFKRADIMRLRAEDPDRYERLQPEILKAYDEDRVK